MKNNRAKYFHTVPDHLILHPFSSLFFFPPTKASGAISFCVISQYFNDSLSPRGSVAALARDKLLYLHMTRMSSRQLWPRFAYVFAIKKKNKQNLKRASTASSYRAGQDSKESACGSGI